MSLVSSDGNEMDVIIVDDEESVARLMATVFSRKGARVSFFADPLEARKYLKKFPPDILLTDFDMPKVTGMRLVRDAQGISPEIGTMCFSGIPANEDEFIIGGGDVFIPKPTSPKTVWAEAEKLFEYKKALRQ